MFMFFIGFKLGHLAVAGHEQGGGGVGGRLRRAGVLCRVEVDQVPREARLR